MMFLVVCTMLVVQPLQGNSMTVESSASVDGAATAFLKIKMPPLQDNKQAIESSSPSSSSHFPPKVKPTSLESKLRGQGHHSSLAKGENAKDLHH